MPTKVIDASALAALLFGEPDADEVADRIRGSTLVCPDLLPFETANVCLKKIRRYPQQRSSLLAAYALLYRMEITQTPVDLNKIVPLAEEKRLTVYDASYLWLARELKADLVTLDRELARAAL